MVDMFEKNHYGVSIIESDVANQPATPKTTSPGVEACQSKTGRDAETAFRDIVAMPAKPVYTFQSITERADAKEISERIKAIYDQRSISK